MTRRRWLALFLPVAPAFSMPDPELHEKIVSFEKAWHPFLLKLYGCTGDTLSTENCRPPLGTTDYGLWQRVRDRAKRLFDLRD